MKVTVNGLGMEVKPGRVGSGEALGAVMMLSSSASPVVKSRRDARAELELEGAQGSMKNFAGRRRGPATRERSTP